jgi:hypothetical protein
LLIALFLYLLHLGILGNLSISFFIGAAFLTFGAIG